jgi:hypothetical protein
MTYIDPYITVTISLLGIAYPILFQVVARLDDKYASDRILELFCNEEEYKLFKWTLIVSLICIALWSLNIWLNLNIPCATEALITWGIFLVCSFFCLIKKLLTYSSTTKFISYLKTKANKAPNNRQYLDAISDILLKYIRKNRPEKIELCKCWTENKLKGEILPEKTDQDIWKILICAIQHEQDDVIMEYWKIAHQYFKGHIERNKYMELHYALGGYLIHTQRYGCIRKFFEYLPTVPPEYVLLPNTIQDILNFYFEVWNLDTNKYVHIANLYPFPQENGWHAELVIRNAICSYMALLFLKQLLLNYEIRGTSLYPPSLSLPETQKETRAWMDALPSFKKLIEEHTANDELMKIMGKMKDLSLFFDEKCANVQSLEFIEGLESELKIQYERNTIELPPSEEKVKQFKNAAKKIVEEEITKINQINNDTDIGNTDKYETKEYLISDPKCVLKNDFSEYSENHFYFDTPPANLVVHKLQREIADSFLGKKTKEISLPPEQIFEAIDKLNINEQYVIVSFGLNLEKENYKDIKIYTFDKRLLLHKSLFILKKMDLPAISFKPIPADVKEKYSLEKIIEAHELYASVIDLNKTTPELLEECKANFNKTDDELKKSALLNIFLSMEVKWKKEIDVIQIKQS